MTLSPSELEEVKDYKRVVGVYFISLFYSPGKSHSLAFQQIIAILLYSWLTAGSMQVSNCFMHTNLSASISIFAPSIWILLYVVKPSVAWFFSCSDSLNYDNISECLGVFSDLFIHNIKGRHSFLSCFNCFFNVFFTWLCECMASKAFLVLWYFVEGKGEIAVCLPTMIHDKLLDFEKVPPLIFLI